MDEDPYSDVRERMESLRQYSATHPPPEHDITWFAAFTTYLGYAVLIAFGRVRDFFGLTLSLGSRYVSPATRKGCAPLLQLRENFYNRRLYHRIQDCFNRPVGGGIGARCRMNVIERVSLDGNKSMVFANQDTNDLPNFTPGPYNSLDPSTGNLLRRSLNLGSYNYLGFADDWNQTCKEDVVGTLEKWGVSNGGCRVEYGTTDMHRELEKLVADFLGKEDSLVLNMGFNTNATTIPALVSRGDLIVSDTLNHTSIVNGARASGAAIRTFKHNNASDLEAVLREAIVLGQPRTHRPWRKIIVMVEGIYSMEGEYCNLKMVKDVCKKYKVYLYLDEAHSIGAMGATGRGCCEYAGVDTADVDVLMGTFTKSFGGMGGYIAADAATIAYLRTKCAGSVFHNSLSPIVCQQILTSFRVIMGVDGTDIGARKLRALRDNSNYMRMRLTDMGLHVLGNYDSPIMPVMLYNPTKIAAFSRECFKRGLAVVVVGFPAVPILMSRARLCISAGHTREDLDDALKKIEEVADICKIRYGWSSFG
ncbi:hypothetical protein TrCOL_g97 [Triparma columacea]|uniref:serine C-palmitoyltransferase n=1 Tax=Triparma columacea TaxID=722753 RepID=A0A9W7GBB2_9STRA|nr:hypothetical protein TrCOL_g97 [Triparma columacea]